MRVELDENLPDSAIEILGDVGYDVDTARAEGLNPAVRMNRSFWPELPRTAGSS